MEQIPLQNKRYKGLRGDKKPITSTKRMPAEHVEPLGIQSVIISWLFPTQNTDHKEELFWEYADTSKLLIVNCELENVLLL